MIHGMQNAEVQSLVIRDARKNDLRRLYDIDQVCFPPNIAYSMDEMRWYLRHPKAISKVAESGGTTVGFAIGKLSAALQAHIITLDVIPEVRRRRVGCALMEALHGEFRSRGIRRVALEVATQNVPAQRFYLSFGYVRQGLLPGYYGEGNDAYRMILEL